MALPMQNYKGNKTSFLANIGAIGFNGLNLVVNFHLVMGIVVLFGIVINGYIAYQTRPWKPEPKKELSYDERWSDPEYVKMIHDTMQAEADNGITLTKCECASHKIIPEFKPKPLSRDDIDKMAGIVKKVNKQLHGYSEATINEDGVVTFHETGEHVIEHQGFRFVVPKYVPANARARLRHWEPDDFLVYCSFRWYDTTGREIVYLAVTSETRRKPSIEIETGDGQIIPLYEDDNEARTVHESGKFDDGSFIDPYFRQNERVKDFRKALDDPDPSFLKALDDPEFRKSIDLDW